VRFLKLSKLGLIDLHINNLLLSCMEFTLLIQDIAHAQVCLFIMCFRSWVSTRVLV